jgi:hypothetical protein
MLRPLVVACLLCLPSAGIWPAPKAFAANVEVSSGLRVAPAIRSMKDLRDRNLVRQRYDFSCGAAALATLLRYGYSEPVGERELLLQLFELLSDEERATSERLGFSLLDLQRLAQARGYRAQGFRLAPQYLTKLKGPVIVYIEPRGYRHFAVLRGIRGDRVYLADPARGNIRMPAYAFLESWLRNGTGVIFVVEPPSGLTDDNSPLAPAGDAMPQPEIMTAREMLSVGNPFVRLPELRR